MWNSISSVFRYYFERRFFFFITAETSWRRKNVREQLWERKDFQTFLSSFWKRTELFLYILFTFFPIFSYSFESGTCNRTVRTFVTCTKAKRTIPSCCFVVFWLLKSNLVWSLWSISGSWVQSSLCVCCQISEGAAAVFVKWNLSQNELLLITEILQKKEKSFLPDFQFSLGLCCI